VGRETLEAELEDVEAVLVRVEEGGGNEAPGATPPRRRAAEPCEGGVEEEEALGARLREAAVAAATPVGVLLLGAGSLPSRGVACCDEDELAERACPLRVVGAGMPVGLLSSKDSGRSRGVEGARAAARVAATRA
jgi:hypothetical protein